MRPWMKIAKTVGSRMPRWMWDIVLLHSVKVHYRRVPGLKTWATGQSASLCVTNYMKNSTVAFISKGDKTQDPAVN